MHDSLRELTAVACVDVIGVDEFQSELDELMGGGEAYI